MDGQWQSYSPPAGLIELSGYEVWSASLPPSDRSETADPDQDNVPNFLEYALGRGGNSAAADDGASQVPAGHLLRQSDGPQFALRIDLPELPPEDVRYVVEAAARLDGP